MHRSKKGEKDIARVTAQVEEHIGCNKKGEKTAGEAAEENSKENIATVAVQEEEASRKGTKFNKKKRKPDVSYTNINQGSQKGKRGCRKTTKYEVKIILEINYFRSDIFLVGFLFNANVKVLL